MNTDGEGLLPKTCHHIGLQLALAAIALLCGCWMIPVSSYG